MSKVYDYYINQQKYCEHKHPEYIPNEDDTNVSEQLICNDCGMDLDLPEPDDNY